MKLSHGGARSGAGKKLGSKHPATITKEQAKEAVRTMVIAALEPLVSAQIANAQGLKYLVARDPKTGKFERIAAAQVDNPDTAIEVWEKDPSVQAFSDLLNRAIDKPVEQKQEHEHTGTFIIKWGGRAL